MTRQTRLNALDQYAFDLWRHEYDEEDLFHEHLLNALRVAVAEELTEVQRRYIQEYYYNLKTFEEIENMFSVNPSTACRTVALAKKRLERVLRYATPALLRAASKGGGRR